MYRFLKTLGIQLGIAVLFSKYLILNVKKQAK